MNLISPLKHSFYMMHLSRVISGLDNKLVFYQSVLFVIANEIIATLGLAISELCYFTLCFKSYSLFVLHTRCHTNYYLWTLL